MVYIREVITYQLMNPRVFKNQPPYALAGLNLTTHSSSLLGDRRRQYRYTTTPERSFLKEVRRQLRAYVLPGRKLS
jgi:hypothetical protein